MNIFFNFASKKNLPIYSSIFLFIACVYILLKILSPPMAAVDFKYFWLAGSLWQEGVNPYGPSFSARARELFVGGSVPPQWAYPPHFRPIAQLMALAPFEIAAMIWRGLIALIIVGSTIKLFAAVRSTVVFPAYVVMIFLAVALTLGATAISVTIGQSSPIIFLGYCLFIYGYLKNDRISLCLALILLMIKPTYGFIPAVFLLAHPRYFGVIALSAAITVILSIWGLWGYDLQATMEDIGAAFTKYKDTPINLAPEMTGLRHLVYFSGFGETSQLIYVAAGSILAFGLGLFVSVKKLAGRDRIRAVVLLGLLILVFAPLHTYDGYFVLTVAIPALALSRLEAVTCLPLLLVTWRSNLIAGVTGLKLPQTETFVGSSVESLAAAATLVAFALALSRSRRDVTRRSA